MKAFKQFKSFKSYKLQYNIQKPYTFIYNNNFKFNTQLNSFSKISSIKQYSYNSYHTFYNTNKKLFSFENFEEFKSKRPRKSSFKTISRQNQEFFDRLTEFKSRKKNNSSEESEKDILDYINNSIKTMDMNSQDIVEILFFIKDLKKFHKEKQNICDNLFDIINSMIKVIDLKQMQKIIFIIHSQHLINEHLKQIFRDKIMSSNLDLVHPNVFRKAFSVYVDIENSVQNTDCLEKFVIFYLKRLNEFSFIDKLYFSLDTLTFLNDLLNQPNKNESVMNSISMIRIELNSVFKAFCNEIEGNYLLLNDNEITACMRILSKVGLDQDKEWKLLSDLVIQKKDYFQNNKHKYVLLLSCYVNKKDYFDIDFFEEVYFNISTFDLYEVCNIITSFSKLNTGSKKLWESLEQKFLNINFITDQNIYNTKIDFFGAFKGFANTPDCFEVSKPIWKQFENYLNLKFVRGFKNISIIMGYIQLIFVLIPYHTFPISLVQFYKNKFYDSLITSNSHKNNRRRTENREDNEFNDHNDFNDEINDEINEGNSKETNESHKYNVNLIINGIKCINHLYILTKEIPIDIINILKTYLTKNDFSSIKDLKFFLVKPVFDNELDLLKKLIKYLELFDYNRINDNSRNFEEHLDLCLRLNSEKILSNSNIDGVNNFNTTNTSNLNINKKVVDFINRNNMK